MRNRLVLRTLLLVAVIGVLLASLVLVTPCLAYTQGDPEVRGMWVQPGYFMNPSATTSMVNNLANGHFNVIVANAAWYGFIFCPPTAPDVSPMYLGLGSYNALDDLCAKAHARGLKVHVWMFTNHIAANDYGQGAYPTHVQNLHPEYLMKNSSGTTSIYWIDPGVPGVETWNYNVAMDLIQNHDIDGISFDYIRYPGWDYGYNDIAIARFNAEFGRTGKPATDDGTFVAWRERQITDFVKKVYANAAAVKPNCCISAAVYQTGSSVLTDWNTWMQKGYLDMVEPMIYETGPASYWYVCLNRDRNAAADRLMVIGQGAGQNSPSQTIGQINDVRDYSFEGLFMFSYSGSNHSGVSIADFCNTMATTPDAYPTPVSFPAMPWKTTNGILKGTVTSNTSGAVIYNATITMNGLTDRSDGTGFYAMMKLTPGTYTVSCAIPGYFTGTAQAVITAGHVTTCDFALTPDITPPVISNVQATGVQPTAATISWTTDEAASSQVEYGSTDDYGAQTTLDATKVTNHTVVLSGLTPSTYYHYRAKSVDLSGNSVVSEDHTFATGCTGLEIIVDNDNANNSGGSQTSTSPPPAPSWIVANGLTGKWSTNYAYITHVAPPDTAWFKWTPNLPVPGPYRVYIWYPQDPAGSRSTGAPFTVYYNGGSQTYSINEHISCGQWDLLGSFDFLAGTSGYVQLGNGTNASGTYVTADAVKFVYDCDVSPPTINSVAFSPALTSGGAPVTITVTATDRNGVASVTAGGVPLLLTGEDTFSGSIDTDPNLGTHPVSIVAKDFLRNQGTTSQSYKTAKVFALTNTACQPGGAVQTGAGQFMYKTWGYATYINEDHFAVEDGSSNWVTVHCIAHTVITGQFVTVYGVWTLTQLESLPEQIHLVF